MGEAIGVTGAARTARQPAYGEYTEPPGPAERYEPGHVSTEAGRSFRLGDCGILFALTLVEGAWLLALGYIAVSVL